MVVLSKLWNDDHYNNQGHLKIACEFVFGNCHCACRNTITNGGSKNDS